MNNFKYNKPISPERQKYSSPHNVSLAEIQISTTHSLQKIIPSPGN